MKKEPVTLRYDSALLRHNEFKDAVKNFVMARTLAIQKEWAQELDRLSIELPKVRAKDRIKRRT